jgi:hypothetical protein
LPLNGAEENRYELTRPGGFVPEKVLKPGEAQPQQPQNQISGLVGENDQDQSKLLSLRSEHVLSLFSKSFLSLK